MRPKLRKQVGRAMRLIEKGPGKVVPTNLLLQRYESSFKTSWHLDFDDDLAAISEIDQGGEEAIWGESTSGSVGP
jgi:hypothetical protein